MKYGTFDFVRSEPKRSDPVDWDRLPAKCCGKCDNWVSPKNKDYGVCIRESDLEYDRFSYADDCCEDFEREEEGV